jgi:hypothetical protein
MGSTPSPLGVLLPSTFTKGGTWSTQMDSRRMDSYRPIASSVYFVGNRALLQIASSDLFCKCHVLHEPRVRVAQVPAHKFSGETHAISEHRYARRSFHPLSQFDGAADEGGATLVTHNNATRNRGAETCNKQQATYKLQRTAPCPAPEGDAQA